MKFVLTFLILINLFGHMLQETRAATIQAPNHTRQYNAGEGESRKPDANNEHVGYQNESQKPGKITKNEQEHEPKIRNIIENVTESKVNGKSPSSELSEDVLDNSDNGDLKETAVIAISIIKVVKEDPFAKIFDSNMDEGRKFARSEWQRLMSRYVPLRGDEVMYKKLPVSDPTEDSDKQEYVISGKWLPWGLKTS